MGIFQTNLFPGAVYDSYKMSIYVQIYDINGAFSIFDFPQQITVIPDLMSNLTIVEERLILNDPSFDINILLNEGSYLDSIREIQKISGLLNEKSLSDQMGLIKFNNNTDLTFPLIYGPLTNYNGILPVKNLYLFYHSTLEILFLNFHFQLQNPNITSNFIYWLNRSKRSQAKDALAIFLNGLSISDMDSIRTQLGMLSLITSQADEISRATEVN